MSRERSSAARGVPSPASLDDDDDRSTMATMATMTTTMMTTRARPTHARGARQARHAVASPTILVKDGNDPESTMRGLTNKRREVIEDMASFASGELSGLLKDPDTNWQPQDWLPHPEKDDFLDQVRETSREEPRADRRDGTRGRGALRRGTNRERARGCGVTMYRSIRDG